MVKLFIEYGWTVILVVSSLTLLISSVLLLFGHWRINTSAIDKKNTILTWIIGICMLLGSLALYQYSGLNLGYIFENMRMSR